MPRRREVPKRKIMPDPVYNSERLAKFINQVMMRGKKSLAESIVYGALDHLKDEVKEAGPLDVFESALEKIRPLVEVKSRRVGGATYQVPVEVSPARGTTLAMKWLISGARARREKTMSHRLAKELIEAYHERGTAIKKREDTHRMAEANKAFAHFRWN